MHAIFFHMDDFAIPIGHLPRRFPTALRVGGIGYIGNKAYWMRTRFPTYNFSFILSGGGEYGRGKACWPVRAPCVITQYPNTYVEYGPSGKWKTWEEFYIIYYRDMLPTLQKMGFMQDKRIGWYIGDSGPTRLRLAELRALMEKGRGEGFTDRIDRICEAMILDSILAQTRESVEPERQVVQEIRDHVTEHFLEAHDFEVLARKRGLSPSTFRRYWRQQVAVPPAKFVMKLRIQEACRLLVETRLRVGEIAYRLQFRDPLYFSRRFHLETGLGALEYRRRHHSPLSLARPEPA